MGTPRDVLSECPRFYVPPGVVLRKLGSVKTAHKYLGLPPLSNISALKKIGGQFRRSHSAITLPALMLPVEYRDRDT